MDTIQDTQPVIVTVPCFSGAPWELKQFTPLDRFRLVTMRLPESLNLIGEYADFVVEKMRHLDRVVLVGDSFGAVISLAVAVRRPSNLAGLVLSGGVKTSNPHPGDAGLSGANISTILQEGHDPSRSRGYLPERPSGCASGNPGGLSPPSRNSF